MKNKYGIILLFCLFQIHNSKAQTIATPISSRQIDSVTELVLKTFNVPGIAVAVVKDGKLIHAKGYGIANLKTGKR
jgi:CubicO group peptidase (beta-lactamase class C family)